MNISIINGLPFISVEVNFRGRTMRLQNVLIDTGSAGTILKAERLRQIRIYPEMHDPISAIRGIGGSEVVFFKTVDMLRIDDDIKVLSFEIEVGEMEYGFPIDGMLGFDFMRTTGLIVDTGNLRLLHQSSYS